jgi:Flp pilus assembly protein TadG
MLYGKQSLDSPFYRQAFRRFLMGRPSIGGAAAVEFGLIVVSLTVMVICVADIGMGFYRKMQVHNAAQAGAEYAMLHGFSASSISNAVTSATSFMGISASPAPTQSCGCASSSTITTVSCSSLCPDLSEPGTYVTVSAQGTYDTLLPYPLLSNSLTFVAQANVRIR